MRRAPWELLALFLAGPLALRLDGATDPPAPATKVVVVSVGDVRSGDSLSRLTIQLELADYPAGDVAAARLLLRRAVDDMGRDLLPTDSGKPSLEPVSEGRSAVPDGTPAPAAVEVTLRNPARKAKVLSELSGELELYLPGRDSGAVVTFPNLPALLGKRIESPALGASGVRIAVLTEEQLEAEKKSQAEKRKEEARKQGVLGEMLEPLASAFSRAFFNPEAGDVVLKVDDPGGRIVRLSLLDAAGEDRTTGRSQQQGLLALSSSRTGPGPGWSLEVRLSTPKSLERRSFVLKDVVLP